MTASSTWPSVCCTPAQLLASMIAIDSVNSAISGKPAGEAALGEHLIQQARAMGLVATKLPIDSSRFNVLIHSPHVQVGRRWLAFESHMDTVGVANMTIDPFKPVIHAGRIQGRGSCDTKGSGAAMLWAVHQHHLSMARGDASTPHNIALLFTIDEEISKQGVNHFITHSLPALPWKPAGVIVGEPTMLAPIIAHNGVVRWTVRTTGIAAHSSDPTRGRSAISMMLRVADAIESRYIPSLSASHPLTGRAQCSVNVIRGGEQINIIPASCEIQIDRRLVPGEQSIDVLPAVEQLLDELRASDAQLRVEQLPPFIDPPLNPAGGQALHQLVDEALRAVGLPAAPQGAAYGTDASSFSDAGIPALVLGPGDIAQAHTADEWLSLDQLEQAARLYLQIMHTPWPGETR